MTKFINEDLKKLAQIPHFQRAVTFFGSARLGRESPYYEQAKALARECVRAGFSVITGGGGGIMQAANEGAFEAGRELEKFNNGGENLSNLSKNCENSLNLGENSRENGENSQISSQTSLNSNKNSHKNSANAAQNLPNSSSGVNLSANKNGANSPKAQPNAQKAHSVGFNIFLPFEQKSNDFLDYNITFKSLAVRKMALIQASLAFVIFPGGFGTLDEFLEVLTLKQLGFKNVPIFALGSEFWRGLDEFIRASLLANAVISRGDEGLYEITDDLSLVLSRLKVL